MALENIKNHFAAAMDDAEAQVIALSGNWGTGKSHLWDEHKRNSSDPAITKAVYASLFGVRTIHALKMKLLAAAAEGAEGKNRMRKFLTSGAGIAAKVLKGLHRSVEAIDDVALLSLPHVLSETFVVLDDIERKHQQLEIDEVLGFIDEFTQKHDTRFLLILNSDKLGDKSVWEKFREKVIDHEIALEISPDEAFEIANASRQSAYTEAMKQANRVLGVTNIRVLSKAIVFIDKLFKNHANLEAKAVKRLVPPALLLCAIHYRVLPNGPSPEYVVAFDLSDAEPSRKSDGENQQRWFDLMDRLELVRSGQFEREVAIALSNGMINHDLVDEAILTHQRPSQVEAANARVRAFVHDYHWNHKKSVDNLLSEANGMLAMGEHMDVDAVSALSSILSELGHPVLAEEFVQRWLSGRDFTPEVASNLLSAGKSERWAPSILDALQGMAAQTASLSRDLASVLERIRRVHYTDDDTHIVSNASLDLYTQMLRVLDKEEFAEVVRQHVDWLEYGMKWPWKAAGVNTFVEACARIVEDEPDTRLAAILRRTVFRGAEDDLRKVLEADDEA